MRVAFVIPYFYPAMWYGGAPRSAYNTARALTRRGHHVTVLTTDSAGPERISRDAIARIERDGIDGIQVCYYRNISNDLAYRHRIFFPPRFFTELRSRLTENQIVHIHELRSFLTVGAHSALRGIRIPYVLSPHGGLRHLGKRPVKVAFDWLWGKSILKDAAAICVISPTEERDARNFSIEPHRIHPLPNGIDAERYKELPRPGEFATRWRLHGRKIVLFLGRLNWIKGPDILIQSMQFLKDLSDVHLVIAGPDDGAELRLRTLVKEQKLEGKVTFTGFLDEEQKLRALVDSYATVIPSRSEAFPITLLEGLACKKPAVVSSACDLDDWIAGRATWLTFRNRDPRDLAEKLRAVLCARFDPSAISAGQNFVLTELSADALAARVEALYGSLIEDKRTFT